MRKISAATVFFLLFVTSLATASEKRYDVPIGTSPYLGPKDALVTIIEFIDFQ